ncbi:MAG: ABC transporter permease subunit [Candidatus Cloacimonetes bacterium]|nr:ABC transporter permease subunit [Candidatus Cloacimonadota bacterium]
MKRFLLSKLLPLIGFLLLWQISSLFFNQLILPSPLAVFGKILVIMKSLTFYSALLVTLLRALGGLIIALSLGIFIGFAMHFSKAVSALMHPVIITLQSLPIISWLLLALIWFDSSVIPVFIVAVSTIPIIILNVYEGLKEVSGEYLELVTFYKLDFRRCLQGLYLPSIATYIISAYKIIIGLCIKTSVMAEVIARVKQGIGTEMNLAWINIDTAEVLAYTVLIVFFTFATERLLTFIFSGTLRNYQ